MNILKMFITEEIVWNYWLRRPKNDKFGDVSNDIDDLRNDVYKSVLVDFDENIQKIKNKLKLNLTNGEISVIISYFKDVMSVNDKQNINSLANISTDKLKNYIESSIDLWASKLRISIQNSNDDSKNLINRFRDIGLLGQDSLKRR